MNPLGHCYALAILLDDPSKGDDARNAVMPTSLEGATDAGPCLTRVLARKEALNRECDGKELQSALRCVLECAMPTQLAKLLVPDNEPWTIQKELELFRCLSHRTIGGLMSIFTVYLVALSEPMKSPRPPKDVSPTSTGSQDATDTRTVDAKKRRGKPPRRARA